MSPSKGGSPTAKNHCSVHLLHSDYFLCSRFVLPLAIVSLLHITVMPNNVFKVQQIIGKSSLPYNDQLASSLYTVIFSFLLYSSINKPQFIGVFSKLFGSLIWLTSQNLTINSFDGGRKLGMRNLVNRIALSLETCTCSVRKYERQDGSYS